MIPATSRNNAPTRADPPEPVVGRAQAFSITFYS